MPSVKFFAPVRTTPIGDRVLLNEIADNPETAYNIAQRMSKLDKRLAHCPILYVGEFTATEIAQHPPFPTTSPESNDNDK